MGGTQLQISGCSDAPSAPWVSYQLVCESGSSGSLGRKGRSKLESA